MSYKPRKFQQRFSVWLKRQNLQVLKWILKLHLFHQCLPHLEPWCFSWAGLEACLRPFWADGGVLPPFFAPRAFYTWDIYRHELLSYGDVMPCHVGQLSSWRCVCSPFSKLTWSAVGRVLAPWQAPLWPLSLAPSSVRQFKSRPSRVKTWLVQIFRSILGQISSKDWTPGQGLQPPTQNNSIHLLKFRT